MVKTRKSINTTGDATQDFREQSQQLDENGRPRAVDRALQKLLIDANPALRGEASKKEKAKSEVAVYHWRGAVYAVDEDTPKEWLENQPSRYKKRKREDDEAKIEKFEDEEGQQDVAPPVKRGRGRPRKIREPVDEEAPNSKKRKRSPERTQASSPRRTSHRSKRLRQDDSEEPTPRPTRSRGTLRSNQPHIPAKSRRRSRSRSAREKAIEQGYSTQAIPWADMMTGKIAISLAKFCAIQLQLRKVKEQYARAVDLCDRIQKHDKAQAEEQSPADSGHEDFDDAQPIQFEDKLDAPLTPEADVVEEQTDTVFAKCRESEDIKVSASQIDAADAQAARNTTPTNRLAEYARQPPSFGPWDALPRKDDHGRDLQWSLRTAKDMDGRAEYHIYTGKLHDREKEDRKAERVQRELNIIHQWEIVEGGRAIVHEDRAHVPRSYTRTDRSTSITDSPRRLPVDTRSSSSP